MDAAETLQTDAMDGMESLQRNAAWLTREEIDRVIANLSAEDMIESGLTGTDDKGEAVKAGMRAFNASAERLGLSNGTPAMQHVHASDLKYFANNLKESLDI